MKELVILSGKGGTGKTTIAGSLAVLAQKKVLADCDVDAPDLHLLLHPEIMEEGDFWSGKIAVIDKEKCIECGECERICNFEAIKEGQVDELDCEGCGLCAHICPVEAITMKDKIAGKWFISKTPYGLLVHARLKIGEGNSGKLVAEVRRRARDLAEREGIELIISDGPPGIGCPVISSLSGAALALLIAEPTASGVHDLQRIIELCRHFQIPALVCINKFDLNEKKSEEIRALCQNYNLDVVAEIPFDKAVPEAISQGIPPVIYSEGPASREIKRLWDFICRFLENR